MYYIVGTNVRMATNHKTMEYLYIAEKKVNLEFCIQQVFLWKLKKNKDISSKQKLEYSLPSNLYYKKY